MIKVMLYHLLINLETLYKWLDTAKLILKGRKVAAPDCPTLVNIR